IPPVHSPWKAGVIAEFQHATVEAQNALLKLLEEPPSFVRIIATADAEDKLLPTIVSRCHVIRIKYKVSSIKYDNSEMKTSTLDVLLNSGVGERFSLAATVGKDRETAVAFLKQAVLAVRSSLLSSYQSQSSPYTKYQIPNTNMVRTFSRALATLEHTNTNPRLLMENLFLQLPPEI
ncbi:hypothetical protein HY468_03315, partial [Candidatus Roizmanbacteria bacterium]|nr:hypothetical protein [Candidatus Roizmanbacteria bacterium]